MVSMAGQQTGLSSHGSSLLSNQPLGQSQTFSMEDFTCQDQQQEEQDNVHLQVQQSSGVNPILLGSEVRIQDKQDGSPLETDPELRQHNQSQGDSQCLQDERNILELAEKNQAQIPENHSMEHPEVDIQKLQNSESQSQYSKGHNSNNQMEPAGDQVNKPLVESKPILNVPFHNLIPMMRPHLDKDRNMHLQLVFDKLRKNEVSKDDFLRVVRNIVGDKMLRSAAMRLMQQREHHQVRAQAQAAQNSQISPGQYKVHSQASSLQLTMPSGPAQQSSEAKPFQQLHRPVQHQKGPGSASHPSHLPVLIVEQQKDTCIQTPESSAPKLLPDGQAGQSPPSTGIIPVSQQTETSMATVCTVSQQQDQFPCPPISFPTPGVTVSNYNACPNSGPSFSIAASSIKSYTQDAQTLHVPHSQGTTSAELAAQPKNQTSVHRYELRSTANEAKKVQSGYLSNLPGNSPLKQNSSSWQSTSNKDWKGTSPSPVSYPRQEFLDQVAKQQLKSPGMGPLKDDAVEKQLSRMSVPTSTSMIGTHQISGPVAKQPDHTMQMQSQIPSAATPAGAGINLRTPPKKPLIGQKKPFEALGTPSTQPSKKQKVSGDPLDQSIECLNDVTAVSGVDLREEEEQLLSAPKEESRASEVTRRVVQEEEERLILQKVPLQKKIEEIMSRCGIRNVSDDVMCCLSMSVEERMLGLITNLIRLSKQRVDIAKPRHRISITSDVRRQILIMNRKAKEEWDKKQAEEAEKLRKSNGTEGNAGVDMDKEKTKDEGRSKAHKANKEEDDKMRTTAANVAARAAVGGDDMLSKWQLMYEQARQKREGGQDGALVEQLGKDQTHGPPLFSGKTRRDNQDTENRGPSSTVATAFGAMRKWNQAITPQMKLTRTISVKDVIQALEREPQMSKSTLIYRLYERTPADAAVER